MSQVKEIRIGDQFGKWKVLSLFRDSKSRKLRCSVECTCGTKGNVVAYNLLNGNSKGCHPCSLRERLEVRRQTTPKIGDKYGKWTVLDTYIGNDNKSYAKIQCECGSVKNIHISDIKGTNMCMRCKGALMKGVGLERSRKGKGELSGTYWNAIIKGAKARNLEFTIDIEDAYNLFLKQNRKCALSGLDIKLGYKNVDGEQTGSIDRIDNSKGYINGNIQWVHKDINNMKHAHTQEYFIELCKAVSSKF